MKFKHLKLPISSFSVEPSFDPERYTKLRIKVMHTGLNLNNTSFGMEAIERAKPTLANIPLLAFIKSTDGEEKKDFGGHDFEIRVTEGDVKFVYLGRPVGMIPETNNYEIVEEDDNTYVVVDGYIWKDYANEALDIIERDGTKSVSMEINVDDYEEQDSYYDITNYKYTGIALLGEDVSPAMIGAKADIFKYSQSTVADMMSQLRDDLAAAYTEEEEIVEPAAESTEDEQEPAEDNAAGRVEDEQEPAEDNAAGRVEDEQEPAEDNSEEEPAEDNSEQEPAEDSSIEPAAENPTEDFEAKYNSLKVQYDELKESYSALEASHQELQTYKSTIENQLKQEKIDELFSKFEDLKGEEFEAVKENAQSFSLEDLETKLYALRGRQMETEAPTNKFSFSFGASSSKQSQEPSWASLVRARKTKEE